MNKIRVVYDSDYNDREYRMLQVNDTVINDFQSGMSVYIKGDDSGQCILSTSTKSFNIEKTDTSNTVLLCERNDDNEIIVKGICGSYMELVNNPVDIRKILSHIPDYSSYANPAGDKIHIHELYGRCLYSEMEIKNIIKTSPYVIEDHNNYLYQVSSKRFHEDLIQLIQFCILNQLSLTTINLDDILALNPPFTDFYIVHMLSYICNDLTNCVDKKRLVYFLARSSFICGEEEPKEWLSQEDLQNRISLWLPSGFDFDITEDTSLLEGVGIHETRGRTPGFRFVDKDLLELNPGDRLRQLFTIESEWTQEDIIPFISDLESFGFGKPGDLLLKYCREVTFDNGSEVKKHYVLRH